MRKMALILLLLCLGLGWLYWDSRQQLQTARAETAQLRQQMALLQQQQAQLQERLVELDKNSIDGLAREANKALLDGWSALVNTIDQEVNKARRSLEQRQAPATDPKTRDPDNSADGTDDPDSGRDSSDTGSSATKDTSATEATAPTGKSI